MTDLGNSTRRISLGGTAAAATGVELTGAAQAETDDITAARGASLSTAAAGGEPMPTTKSRGYHVSL